MKKNYNNSHNRDRKRYNENPNKKFQHPKPENTSVNKKSDFFQKNASGFLIISLFVKEGTVFQNIISSIEAAIAVDQKKKIIISFESQSDKSLIASVKKKFEGAFGIFFYNPKAKFTSNSSINTMTVHREVLNAFKSNFFLMLDANVVIRSYSVEKMITFLSKPGDVLAISPKFYDNSQNIIHGCKRFFSIKDFISSSQKLQDEHFMMERGEVGYYSIHRIDYGNLDCMLFVTDALLKLKCFPKFKNQDLRDAVLCKKFSKKTKGKIMFYPHARVITNSKTEEKPSFIEKIKYIISNAF